MTQSRTTPHPSRLGIIGGTFDPVHVGHLAIAEEARVRLALDEVLFVPARVSPFKLGNHLASGEDRLRMVELAIADNPRFRVSRLELDREGPSYTVDTLRMLREASGERTELFFIMGMDSLETLTHWRHPQEILRLARLVVISRPGFGPDWGEIEAAIPGASRAITVIDSLQLDISSTDLRERVREGLPIRYLVPAPVEAYIREHHLYAE